MTQERLLAMLRDGVPPCGRVLVSVGRIAVIECSHEERAELAADAFVWPSNEPPPPALPELDADESEFVAASAASTAPKTRPREGLDWDSPGALPPDPPI